MESAVFTSQLMKSSSFGDFFLFGTVGAPTAVENQHGADQNQENEREGEDGKSFLAGGQLGPGLVRGGQRPDPREKTRGFHGIGPGPGHPL